MFHIEENKIIYRRLCANDMIPLFYHFGTVNKLSKVFSGELYINRIDCVERIWRLFFGFIFGQDYGFYDDDVGFYDDNDGFFQDFGQVFACTNLKQKLRDWLKLVKSKYNDTESIERYLDIFIASF